MYNHESYYYHNYNLIFFVPLHIYQHSSYLLKIKILINKCTVN
jgi:hypothetical protein